MTAIGPTGAWDGRNFAHEGFAFGTDRELTDRVVPFVAEGLSRDEPVLVVAGERVRALLVEELGADVARLTVFSPAETWWRGGPGTLQAYDRDLRALMAATPSWRLAAEPIWLARDEGRVWSRFESVANRCYAALPYYSLCLHDTRVLPPTVLDAVACTHPLSWGGDRPVATPGYQEPEAFLRSVQPAWSPRPGDAVVSRLLSPREARAAVLPAATGMRGDRAEDVVLATHELVANGLRVSASVEVATWTEGDRLVVEVADEGPGLPDATLGYVPPGPDQVGGRGLWLAWSLADDAGVDPDGPGTRIRLQFAR